jgi:hypothetical protein
MRCLRRAQEVTLALASDNVSERRAAHGEKKNRVLGTRTTVLAEANSDKAWQRGRLGRRGRLSRFCAPLMPAN